MSSERTAKVSTLLCLFFIGMRLSSTMTSFYQNLTRFKLNSRNGKSARQRQGGGSQIASMLMSNRHCRLCHDNCSNDRSCWLRCSCCRAKRFPLLPLARSVDLSANQPSMNRLGQAMEEWASQRRQTNLLLSVCIH